MGLFSEKSPATNRCELLFGTTQFRLQYLHLSLIRFTCIRLRPPSWTPSSFTLHACVRATIGTVTAGMLGLMGNKGGVGVSFRLRNSSLCFISSHLAAHRDNVRSRNDNYFKVGRIHVFAAPLSMFYFVDSVLGRIRLLLIL